MLIFYGEVVLLANNNFHLLNQKTVSRPQSRTLRKQEKMSNTLALMTNILTLLSHAVEHFRWVNIYTIPDLHSKAS